VQLPFGAYLLLGQHTKRGKQVKHVALQPKDHLQKTTTKYTKRIAAAHHRTLLLHHNILVHVQKEY
jgi:hypothetical protein